MCNLICIVMILSFCLSYFSYVDASDVRDVNELAKEHEAEKLQKSDSMSKSENKATLLSGIMPLAIDYGTEGPEEYELVEDVGLKWSNVGKKPIITHGGGSGWVKCGDRDYKTAGSWNRFTGGEWFNLRYPDAMYYHNELVDLNVRFDFGDSRAVTDDMLQGYSHLTISESAFGGWTYFNAAGARVAYKFYYAGTNTVVPINLLYSAWGSVNIGEGCAPYDVYDVKVMKFPGSYPSWIQLGPRESIYRPQDGQWMKNYWDSTITWLCNNSSNDFEDDMYKPTFWKSVATIRMRSDDYTYRFRLLGPNFWFTPSFAAMGPVAPSPQKKIVDGNSRLDSVTRHMDDEVVYEISQEVSTYGILGTSYVKYSNFSFKDVLPEGLVYDSARVICRTLNGSESDVTGYGTLSYNQDTRTVSFVFDESWVRNGMSYNGESYILRISCDLQGTSASRVLTNQAETRITNTVQKTNKVEVHQPVYYVRFDDNNEFNPNHQTGEFTQNVVDGSMSDMICEWSHSYDLNVNTYSREGYDFVGWNTKSDGSGTAYSDGAEIENLTDETDGVVILYAQWRKKLGTETITIISEETGNPVSNVEMKLQKKVNGVWTDVTSGTTSNNGNITVDDLHWFDYRWVMTEVPAGYVKSADTLFTITYNQLSATNQVVLYMKRVSIVLDSRVSDIIHGEAAPSFMYMISGTDVAGVQHSYNLMVQTSGSSKFGTNRLDDLFAGTYKVTQIPVSRYVAENAQNVRNSTPDGVNATVDVVTNDVAEVLFPYTINQYGGLSHTDGVTNKLEK